MKTPLSKTVPCEYPGCPEMATHRLFVENTDPAEATYACPKHIADLTADGETPHKLPTVPEPEPT